MASRRLTTDGITWAMSRWVITNRASGYTSRRASIEPMCAGRLEPPRLGRELPLEELEDPLVVPVGRAPCRSARSQRLVVPVVAEGAEHRRAEVEGHDLQALGRAGRRARQHRLELRGHLVDQRDLHGRFGDARVGVVGGRVGRRGGRAALPGEQRPGARVFAQQEAQRGRAGAGQSETEQRRQDLLRRRSPGGAGTSPRPTRRVRSRPIAWSRSTAMPSSLNEPACSAPSSRATSPSWNESSPRSVQPGAGPRFGDHLVDHRHRSPRRQPRRRW